MSYESDLKLLITTCEKYPDFKLVIKSFYKGWYKGHNRDEFIVIGTHKVSDAAIKQYYDGYCKYRKIKTSKEEDELEIEAIVNNLFLKDEKALS